MSHPVHTPPEILEYNRKAWDAAVEYGSIWTVPVSPEVIANARIGKWAIVLTPTRAVPQEWFPPLEGADVLCLASGGGQQGPVLAAAGARVTVLDNSPAQLARDREVAAREGLDIRLEQGDMADLSRFPDASFDLIVHPCSNLFVPDVRPVWRECARVLRPGGTLLAGFNNPVKYIFDQFLLDEGQLVVKYKLPYSDIADLPVEQRQQLVENQQPFEWSHTLEAQLSGQMEAGLHLTGLYEDRWSGDALEAYTDTFIATRAVKPKPTA